MAKADGPTPTPDYSSELASFASLAVHDLKGPLQLVSGFTSLLRETSGDALDDAGREYLDWIADSARSMDSIITDLLTYATVEASDKPFVDVDLNDTLAAVVVELKSVFDAKRAVVTAQTLPVVKGDPGQLQLVLRHLLENAVKFVAEGVAPVVQIGATPENSQWRIGVFDNGIGVDPADSTKIFVGLHRLNSKDNYPGTGLGLAICRRVVERHGGTVAMERRPEGGSHTYFTIPTG